MNLRRIFAYLFSIGLAVFLTLGVLAYASDRSIYEPQVYLDSFEKNGLYAKIPGRVAAIINDQLLDNNFVNLDPITSQISTDTWEQIYAILLPQDFIRDSVDDFTNSVFSYINLETPSLEFTVDLVPIRQGLSGEQSNQVAKLILDGLPECDASDVFSLIDQLLNGQLDQIQACRLPEPYNAYVEGFIAQSIQGIGNSLPDQLVIDSDAGTRLLPIKAQDAFNDLMATYRLFRVAITILPFLALAMVPLLILVTYHDAKEILTFFGWGFTLSGIATLLISLLEYGLRGAVSKLFLIPWQSIVGDEANDLIVALSSDIIAKFAVTAGLIASIVLIVGVAMLWGRKLLKR